MHGASDLSNPTLFRGEYNPLLRGYAAVVHPDGYVEIRDRLKDVKTFLLLKWKGVLLGHPAVEEVAIVGFPHERWGEAPHVFVVLKQGARVDEHDLREFARANLAHFKGPAQRDLRPNLHTRARSEVTWAFPDEDFSL